jgi:hypothetical protein
MCCRFWSSQVWNASVNPVGVLRLSSWTQPWVSRSALRIPAHRGQGFQRNVDSDSNLT